MWKTIYVNHPARAPWEKQTSCWILVCAMALQWRGWPGATGAASAPSSPVCLQQHPSHPPVGISGCWGRSLAHYGFSSQQSHTTPRPAPRLPSSSSLLNSPNIAPEPLSPQTLQGPGLEHSGIQPRTTPCPAAVPPIPHPWLIKARECTAGKTEKCSPYFLLREQCCSELWLCCVMKSSENKDVVAHPSPAIPGSRE